MQGEVYSVAQFQNKVLLQTADKIFWSRRQAERLAKKRTAGVGEIATMRGVSFKVIKLTGQWEVL